MGFEPTISSVTGWRALRAAPRGRDCGCDRIVPDGLEPSLPGCRPGVVAAGPRDCICCFVVARRKPWDSNPQSRFIGTPVFETGPSSGRMTSVRVLSCGGWNRTSGLLIQSQASLPAATAPQCFINEVCSWRKVRGEGFEPSLPASKADGLPLADPRMLCVQHQSDRRVPCGSWTRLSGLEDRCLCRSAKGTLRFHLELRWQESNLRHDG
jgi:hypothetical protein